MQMMDIIWYKLFIVYNISCIFCTMVNVKEKDYQIQTNIELR